MFSTGMNRSSARRALAVVSVVSAACLLAACGDSGSEDEAASGSDAKPKNVVLGWTDGFGGNSWRKVAQAEIQDEIKKNYPEVEKIVYLDGGGSAQKAIADLRSLRSQGVDAVITLPDAGPAVAGALRSVTAAGIPTVPELVPADPKGPPEPGTLTRDPKAYTAYVGEDTCAWGAAYGEYMAQKLDKGTVVFFGGPANNSYSQSLYDCAKKKIAESGKPIKLVGPLWTEWDVQKAQASAKSALTKYPKIDGIISDYGASLPGALKVFESSDAGFPKVIVSQEYNGIGRIWVESGKKFDYGIASTRTWAARASIRTAMALLNGKKACTGNEGQAQNGPPEKSVYDKCIPTWPQWTLTVVDAADVDEAEAWNKDLPDDSYPSSHLTPEEQKELLAG